MKNKKNKMKNKMKVLLRGLAIVAAVVTCAVGAQASVVSAPFESDFLPGGAAECLFVADVGGTTATCNGTFSQHGPLYSGVGANRPMTIDLWGWTGDTATVPADLWQRVEAFGDAGFWGYAPHTPFGFANYLLSVDGASRDLVRVGMALLYWHDGELKLNLWADGSTLVGPRGSEFVITGDYRMRDPLPPPPPGEVPEPGTFAAVVVGLLAVARRRG